MKTKVQFDASFGLLKLSAAGFFQIKVEEFDKRKKQIDSDFAKDEQFARDKWNERANAEWTKVKLEENWKANETQRNTKKTASNADLEKHYEDVNWVWVVALKQLQANELSHNNSFSKGIKGSGHYNLKFPKVLEGGGLTYLEAFQPADGAKGKNPFGVFVQATGKPKIVRVEWTDFEYNLLKGKVVAFNSEVLLHIYTEALYGQELEIQLFDEDIFRDDELNISEKSNFQREVDIHKVHPKEVGKPGIADTLVKAGQDKTDNVIEKENYLQKITIEVKVDYGWMKLAGKNLKIYPTVKSLKTGEYFENFSREFLEIAMNGVLYDVPKEVTNMPVVQSEISTNVADNHPCQYTALYYTNNDNGTIPIFIEESGVESNFQIELGIIAGSDPENFSLSVDDAADTTECRFDGTRNDHEPHIFQFTSRQRPSAVSITSRGEKDLSGNVHFDYERSNMLQYFWLPENYKDSHKFPHMLLLASTCRHQKNINLTVLPNIEWELAFIIVTMAGLRIKADDTTITRLQQGLGENQFRGIRAEQNGRIIKKGGLGYSLNMKYSINGGSFYEQISVNFVRNIEKIIDSYNAVAGFVEIFRGDESSVTSAAVSQSVINRLTFDILPPSIIFLLKWKYARAKANNELVVDYTGAFGCKPLIGLTIGVDLVQNADKFGGLIGAIITWGARIIKRLTRLDLYIIVECTQSISFDIGLSYNRIDGFAPNTKQKVTLDLTFSFKAGIKRKDVVMVADVRRMQGNMIPTNAEERETFKVEGAATTGIRYTEELGVDPSKGKFKKTETKWMRAEMTITIVSVGHNRRSNAPPNDEFKEKFLIKGPKTIFGPETTFTQNE